MRSLFVSDYCALLEVVKGVVQEATKYCTSHIGLIIDFNQ